MRSTLVAWLFVSSVSLGCSVIAEPSDRVRCDATLGNPCPDGWTCRDGFCEPAECTVPMPESCNSRDDDCDGRVDEGVSEISELCNGRDEDCDGRIDEGFDFDEDGFNVCGTQDCADPDVPCMPNDPTKVDCNDNDDSVESSATSSTTTATAPRSPPTSRRSTRTAARSLPTPSASPVEAACPTTAERFGTAARPNKFATPRGARPRA